MTKFGIGQPVPRTEDARLLRGDGCFTADITVEGQVHAVFLRSPHAHATIRSIDVSAALAAPGVLAVYTADDLKAAGIGPIPCLVPLRNRNGTPMVSQPRPVLAWNRVRHVGDPVAAVIAETPAQAHDAAERIRVDYLPHDAVTDTAGAVNSGVQVWGDAVRNIAFDWAKGDAAAVDAAFAAADRIVSLDLVNNRLVPNPMETRACLARFDRDANRYEFWVGSQGVHFMQQVLSGILAVPKESLRVRTTDVGGGFGMKMFVYPEYVLTLFAARRLGRPVKWVSDRAEGFLCDDHGRDHVAHAELALDKDGRFLALRAHILANLGAYLSNYAPYIPTEGVANMLSGVYRIPAIHAQVLGVYTHTAPVDAYRGAGRPEAAYLVERLVDTAARELGIDPAELRRRNFIPPEAMPYKTPLQHSYDSGNFQKNMEDALARADAAGFPARRKEARTRGKLRGLGLATYIEACSGGPPEQATIQVRPDGKITVLIGTQTNGQGHQTSYQQILADRLGVPLEDVQIVQGDTDLIAFGQGTGGSRSIPVGGAVLAETARKIVDAARLRAADLLEAAALDVVFTLSEEGGRFEVVGTDRRVSFQDVARAAGADASGYAFQETARWAPAAATFPNGCHVCEIEVDIDTGQPEIVRYTVVDDFGTVLNPLLLEGQVHGGIGQGIGQALFENTVYDPQSGQLMTGSFMDYALPRADGLPFIDFHRNTVPCTTNPLGMKGAGEAGSIGAPPAVINALVDALAEFGVRHIDMPATPLKLWHLMHAPDRPPI